MSTYEDYNYVSNHYDTIRRPTGWSLIVKTIAQACDAFNEDLSNVTPLQLKISVLEFEFEFLFQISILDVGCGTGNHLYKVLSNIKVGKAVGVEVNDGMRSKAVQKLSKWV